VTSRAVVVSLVSLGARTREQGSGALYSTCAHRAKKTSDSKMLLVRVVIVLDEKKAYVIMHVPQ
jgi:hypothetical protein